MSHVGNTSSPEVIPSPEHIVCIIWMVGSMGHGSQPQIPVKSFRYRWGVCGITCPLRPYRAVGPVVYFAEGANTAFADPLFGQIVTAALAPCQEVGADTGVLCRFNDKAGLVHPVRQRLVDHYVFTLLHRRD